MVGDIEAPADIEAGLSARLSTPSRSGNASSWKHRFETIQGIPFPFAQQGAALA